MLTTVALNLDADLLLLLFHALHWLYDHTVLSTAFMRFGNAAANLPTRHPSKGSSSAYSLEIVA